MKTLFKDIFTRSYLKVWKAFAEKHGAKYEEFGFPTKPLVLFRHHGIIMAMKPDSSKTGTVVSANIPNPANLRFEINPHKTKEYVVQSNYQEFSETIDGSKEIRDVFKNKAFFQFQLDHTDTLRLKTHKILNTAEDIALWYRVFKLTIGIIDSTDFKARRKIEVSEKETGSIFSHRSVKKLAKGLSHFSALTINQRPKMAWMRFASEYGAEYEEIKGRPVVSYRYAGAKIVLHKENREMYQLSVIRSNLPNSDDFRFWFSYRIDYGLCSTRPLFLSQWGKEVATGKKEIDTTFVLYSNRPEIAKAIFSSEPVFRHLPIGFKCDFSLALDFMGTLRYEAYSNITLKQDWDMIVSLFKLMIDIFHSGAETDESGISLPGADFGRHAEVSETGHTLEGLIGALKNDSVRVRRDSVSALGQMGDARAIEPLAEALKNGDVVIREEAAKALGMIGNRRAVNPLADALGDNLFVCREAANALGRIGGMTAVRPLLQAENRMRVTQSMTLSDSNRSIQMEVRMRIGNALTSMIRSNKKIMAHYPRLFCSKCLRRAEKIRIRKGMFKDIQYVVCPACKDVDCLLTGAKEIVGLIGGSGEDVVADGGSVYVRLWLEREKRMRYADIDRLVIRAGDVAHYEQAVNALILELTGDASRPVSSTRGIPVRLEGKPPLSDGSLQMLKSNFDFQG